MKSLVRSKIFELFPARGQNLISDVDQTAFEKHVWSPRPIDQSEAEMR